MNHLTVTYIHRSHLESDSMEGVQHIKTLPWLSVVQVLEGSYDIALGGSPSARVPPGGFFVAPSQIQQNITHHADPATGRMRCRWVFLDTRVDGGPAIDRLCTFPLIPAAGDVPALNDDFDRLFAADDPFDLSIAALQILKRLYAMADLTEARSTDILEPALDLIGTHYQERLTVERLAASVSLSPSHFHALFRKYMGISPIGYLNHYRMSLAAELLLQTRLAIQEIGRQVGVEDPAYFQKMFRKTYQTSPSRYRNLYGEPAPESPVRPGSHRE